MGKTIRLDDDVAERLEAEAARSQRNAAEVANDVLRKSLESSKPFRIQGPFVRSRPGISFENVEQLLDKSEGPHRK